VLEYWIFTNHFITPSAPLLCDWHKKRLTLIKMVTETKSILLKIYLQPKSSKNEVVGPHRDGIKVKITVPPIEGKANEALIRFLAKELGVSPSCIEITRGQHSREKTLKISGDMDQELLKKIGIIK